jgi:tetratricopeptide (TPR) repeat protein
MVPDVILRRWRAASAIGEHVEAIATDAREEAWAFIGRLAELDPDAARRELADRDGRRNLNCSWLLLQFAVAEADPVSRAQRAVEWARLVAEYGDNDAEQRALEAHCEFYEGVLQHHEEQLVDSRLSYARAAESYRYAGAGPLMEGLPLLAQGIAAVQGDDVEGRSMYVSVGADECFRKARLLLEPVAADLLAEIDPMVDRLMRQSALLDELLQADDPDSLLAARADLTDRQLLGLFTFRIRRLAVNEGATATLLAAVRLAGEVAERLGTTYDTGPLLDYLFESRRWDGVEALLRQRLSVRPGDPQASRNLAKALFLQGKYQEARPFLEELVQQDDQDAELHTVLGVTLTYLHQDAAARRHLRRALELNPDDSNAAALLQQISPGVQVGFADGVLNIAGDVEELASDDLAAAITAATVASDPKGPQLLEEIETTDPGLARRVKHLLASSEAPASMTAMAPPKQSSGEDAARWHLDQAERLFQQARWEEAANAYERAIAADHDLAPAYMGRGDVHYRVGEYHLAIAFFQEALAIRPDAFTYRFLGDSYRRVGKHRQAMQAYTSALELNPGYQEARVALDELRAEDDRA